MCNKNYGLSLFIMVIISTLSILSLEANDIRGRVIEENTGIPLIGANIIIAENNRGTASDRKGYFRIQNLSDGEYTLRVQYVGYLTVTKSITLPTVDKTFEIIMAERTLEIDEIVVTASPLGSPVGYQPAQSLSGESLQRRAASSIGEMLDGTPGIAMRSFGSAPARPVIRGLDGDRVLVLENGERMGDLAETAADHAIAMDPLAADKIEIVRGPASLLYGSSALGGVVNIFNEDNPRYWSHGISGIIALQGASMNNAGAGFGRIMFGTSHWITTGRISYRSTGDIRTPKGVLSGTFMRSLTGGAGFGYSSDKTSGGFTINFLDNTYGLPDALDDPGEDVEIRMDRISLQGRLDRELSGFFKDFEIRMSGAQYSHREFEIERQDNGSVDDEVGLEFTQSTISSTITVRHGDAGLLSEGAIGVNALFRSLKVGGMDAITPNARSTIFAMFVYEETPVLNNLRLQFGGRLEKHSISSVANEQFPDADIHRTSTTFSGSAGLNYRPFQSLEIGFQFARAHRTPTVEELFSNAPHLGTGKYEIGDPALKNEIGHGLDLFAKISTRSVQIETAGFINSIDNFIFLRPTGDIHALSGLPVYIYESNNALLTGVEVYLQTLFSDRIHFEAQFSYVRGSRRDAESIPLPFMPPLRGNAGLTYDYGSWWIGSKIQWADGQTRVIKDESATDGFVLFGIEGGYRLHASGRHILSLQINNLFDTTYRDHLSRVEDRDNPMPGRNASIMYKWYF
jgi:iron complex outermembrane recepter protein